MTRWPRWAWWGAATVTVWAAWVILIYMPLRGGGQRNSQQRIESEKKEQSLLQQIQSAPQVVARLDSLRLSVESTSSILPRSDRLNDYIDHLTLMGDSAGVHESFANPDLVDMLSVALPNDDRAVTDYRLDTLTFELGGVGEFGRVGTWLDLVESDPAFRWWRLCQWDKGKDAGTVSFRGFATFVVAVPPEGAS